MPNGFYKVTYAMAGIIAVTGCLSNMTAPLTFGPLVALATRIYLMEGNVTEGAMAGWHIFSVLTFVQLSCVILMLPASIWMEDAKEQQTKYGRRSLWSQYSLGTLMFWICVPFVVILGLAFLYFPILRGVSAYPGVTLQMLPASAMLLWGLFLWVMVPFSKKNRSRHRVGPQLFQRYKRFSGNEGQLFERRKTKKKEDLLPPPKHAPLRDRRFERRTEDTK